MTESKHQQEARELERIWIAKRYGIGGHYEWQVYEREEHLGLLADEPPIKYVPASLLSSRDAEVREVLEGLRDDDSGCWCVHFGSEYHTNACLAARGLWERVQD